MFDQPATDGLPKNMMLPRRAPSDPGAVGGFPRRRLRVRPRPPPSRDALALDPWPSEARVNLSHNGALGRFLVQMGLVASDDLFGLLRAARISGLSLRSYLLRWDILAEADLYPALSRLYHTSLSGPADPPPDVRLIDLLGPGHCRRQGVLPLRDVGPCTLIATAAPETFAALLPTLQKVFGPVRMVLLTESDINTHLSALRQLHLTDRAEERLPADRSCRRLAQPPHRGRRAARLGLIALLCLCVCAAPTAVWLALTLWTVLCLCVTTGYKLAAAVAQSGARYRLPAAPPTPRDKDLPVISLLVPLFDETDISQKLIARLTRLDYPHDRIDLCLVVEECDQRTQETLRDTLLPPWMRVITVPPGRVRTKPRAMNYALDFCHGSIIGIFDAEDAPERDQLRKVAAGFAHAPEDVACLQGVLDFYNPRRNWMSRCFTIEYASWWRIILPGYERMGLTVPLGGTTLFFRRDILETLGAWDAHNVTEDADLGVRLARHGYRTVFLPSTTFEEANCRPWPWIKQRSRWLKGYALTYLVHMRHPLQLLRDLGLRRFCGLQVLFLGALTQTLFAPLLWSFWAFPLGLPHPLRSVLPPSTLIAIIAVFLLSEAITVAIGLLATAEPERRWLWPWVPTLHLYYALASIALMRALWQAVFAPFVWEKTRHGVEGPTPEPAENITLNARWSRPFRTALRE